MRNNAHTHILGALKAGIHEILYEVTGLDFDNGSEFRPPRPASTGSNYRYDTREEGSPLNRPWPLVNDRLNYLTPTIEPIGYARTADRRRGASTMPRKPAGPATGRRHPQPPRLAELTAYRDSLNPAKIAREIADLQNRLLLLAKEKTDRLYLAQRPTALPNIRKGIRMKAC